MELDYENLGRYFIIFVNDFIIKTGLNYFNEVLLSDRSTSHYPKDTNKHQGPHQPHQKYHFFVDITVGMIGNFLLKHGRYRGLYCFPRCCYSLGNLFDGSKPSPLS